MRPLVLLSLSVTLGLGACGGEEFSSESASGGHPSGSGGTSGAASGGVGGGASGGAAGSASGGQSGGGPGGASGSGGTGGTGGSGGTGGTGGKGGTGGSGGAAGAGGSGGTGGFVGNCPTGGIQSLKDAFAATLNLTTWSKYFLSKGTIDSFNGDLVASPAMDAGHYVGITSTKTYSLDGCMMWIEVKQPLAGSFNGETYFMAAVSGSMDAEITAAADSTSASGLKLVFGVEENSVEDNQSIHYDATAHRWWRMRFPTGKVGFDTSPDGKTWTERRLATRPTGMSAAYVEIGAGTSSANATQPKAIFDRLDITPP